MTTSSNVLNTSRRSRSEEHTSELQSRSDLVCRLLLEKKKKKIEHVMNGVSQNGIPVSTCRVALSKTTQTNTPPTALCSAEMPTPRQCRTVHITREMLYC